MKYVVDHDYHIHSYLSPCGNCPEQTTELILDYARKNKLSSICLTDHYWDELVPWDNAAPTEGANYKTAGFAHISKALPLPQDNNIKFYFGCECEMDKDFRLSIPKERYEDFDFILVPTTHMHMPGLTIPQEAELDEDAKAKLWIERLDRLLDTDLPFPKVGIAHLATSLIHTASREGFLRILNLIKSEEMERVFTRISEAGCSLELNRDDFFFYAEEREVILRMFKIAKGCGCKFHLGSDAHTPTPFIWSQAVFEYAINQLDLKESDKFYIEK